MLWYLLIGSALGAIALTLLMPTTRRVWSFYLTALRYLGLWLLDRAGVRSARARAGVAEDVPLRAPLLLRRFCEDMGPSYIKLAQLLASSGGVVPEPYVREFQACLDRVRPFRFSEVRELLRSDLGDDEAADLADIDPEPLASASIAQVHSARLRDGTDVVIKVQRPGIAQSLDADVQLMRVVARLAQMVPALALVNPVGIVEDFAATVAEELDFRREAHNLDRFNDIMRQLGQSRVRAPVPQWKYTTRRVLVMQRFFGVRVDAVDEIARRDIDPEETLLIGMRAWFQSVLLHGFFHGDVHAGNLMLLDDNDLGFLDFGIVGRLSEHQRRQVADCLIALSTGNYRQLADVLAEMCELELSSEKRDAIARDLEAVYAPLQTLSFSEVQYAQILPQVQRVARRYDMSLPRAFVLITKQILYFDRYAKLLAPQLNVFTDPRLLAAVAMDLQTAQAARAQAGGPGERTL
ncbi:ABC1 kinase family protein [Haliangium ochraceum]|uniref:ABC-1 domain protein n=1 Tax=Haliangium ochraceum (strain DSM 14365 / JCM 11303 / SMP-2) TaxID=502025 RepID=D0LN75_HALO1|nr:AarF/UbiB family protein [Haliangium ochraceum]ACY15252.1 ABC-1 domain protein [Haliangium ochraceum DSM 14365]